MNRAELIAPLEEHLWAQSQLNDGILKRAGAAGDPRLRCAWIRQFTRILHAMAMTGSAMAQLKWAPAADTLVLSALRLPALPLLPKEADPPLSKNLKTTSRQICNRISSLEDGALSSSPACGGGAEGERSEPEAEGALCDVSPFLLGADAPSHLPRKRGEDNYDVGFQSLRWNARATYPGQSQGRRSARELQCAESGPPHRRCAWVRAGADGLSASAAGQPQQLDACPAPSGHADGLPYPKAHPLLYAHLQRTNSAQAARRRPRLRRRHPSAPPPRRCGAQKRSDRRSARRKPGCATAPCLPAPRGSRSR
jgi:hypothetical protein